MVIPGNDGDILEQVDLQERFLKFASSSVVQQSRIATKHTSGAWNSRVLTGNVGHSRAARCLRVVKLFHFIQGIHVVLQSPDLRQELIHSKRFFFSFEHKIHLFSVVELLPSLHDTFSVTIPPKMITVTNRK